MSLLDYHRWTPVEPETETSAPPFHSPSGSLMRRPAPFAPSAFSLNVDEKEPITEERFLPMPMPQQVTTGQLQVFDQEMGRGVVSGGLPRTTGTLRQSVTITSGLVTRKRGIHEPMTKVSLWKFRLTAHLITFAGLTFMLLSAIFSILPADSRASILLGGNAASTMNVSNLNGNGTGGQLGLQSSTPEYLNWSQMGSDTSDIPIDGAGRDVNRFPWGQCTRYSNDTYHSLSGHWVPWDGNAEVWNDQAARYGWIVSATPHFPSIIVIERYVQEAGGVGHVAIAESQNADGSISTSNWNWGGIGAIQTMVNFMPGPGISFVYFPGM